MTFCPHAGRASALTIVIHQGAALKCAPRFQILRGAAAKCAQSHCLRGPVIRRWVSVWGDSMAAGQRSGDRDLRILEAFLGGVSVQDLAEHYKLSRDRIGVIVRAERLKIEVSPMVEYRERRAALKR